MTSTSCSCQPKLVYHDEMCKNGTNEWKNNSTRAKFSRVATMKDALTTRSIWCYFSSLTQWQLIRGDTIKLGGWGYKCSVENYGSQVLIDHECPSGWGSFLMCLACPKGKSKFTTNSRNQLQS